MAEQFQKGLAGHLVKIMINENLVGFGRSSQVAEDFGLDSMYMLGTIAPQEHVQMRWSGTVSLDTFVINQQALDPQTVQLFELIAQGVDEVKEQATFNFVFLGQNEEELFTLLECTPSNFSLSLQANQYAGQNATFQAKDKRRGPAYQFRGAVSQGLGADLGV